MVGDRSRQPKMFWKHCSRLKNPVLGPMSNNAKKKPMKHPENTD